MGDMVCERPPAASRLSPFVRGTIDLIKLFNLIKLIKSGAFSPLKRGRAAEGGRGSLTRHVSTLLCLPVFVSALVAQDQPFTIKVRTQLVVQTVSVNDKDGKPIEGLTKDDFILTEDGAPQTISTF